MAAAVVVRVPGLAVWGDRVGGWANGNRRLGGNGAAQGYSVQSVAGSRDMLTSPCFGVLLVPSVRSHSASTTTLLSVQNKQFVGHFVWDPQCFLRLRSLHVNPLNPYVGFWTGASALQHLRHPVTMETRYYSH